MVLCLRMYVSRIFCCQHCGRGGGESGGVDGGALVTAQNFAVTEVFTTTKMSYSMLLFISNHMNLNVRLC